MTLWLFYGFTALGLALLTQLIIIAYQRQICPENISFRCKNSYIVLQMTFGVFETQELKIMANSRLSTGK